MKKQISFEIETEEEDQKIENHLMRWIKDNFQKCDKVIIHIDNIIMCPKCKDMQLIPCPVNGPTEDYWCPFCNKVHKKEDVEKDGTRI